MPKFAANLTMMFNEVPFLDRFEAAAKAGFRYVEYLWPYEYDKEVLKRLLDQYELKQVLFNTAAGNVSASEWGVSAIPGREEDSHKDIDMALEYALALGCENVHVMAAVVPEDQDREAYKQTFIENVRYAADKFKPYGIKVLLEALSPEVKPNYLLKSQFDTLEIVEAVQRENVFVQLDYFHAQNVDGNLSRLTDKLDSKFAHVQIASVPDRHEPDEGEINYAYIFNKLDEIGYEGYVGCEYKPRANTVDGLQWFQPYKNR
ncbi:hydroxypyruvate isomerase family protein [Glaesserella parasuis]|uniref:2-oxo-tetronate isomerase n=1 Tax=Glaesserella parasuis TaxID=738 RepID=UPI000DD3CDED|nr:2-oxo-tetronate isomerase [Glaesserella parasuis]MCT8526628.1 hydroxypyruvate isomerase family protein [Glaesserella parasuis]MCT8528760.1 hydroxypyruvate isomerase family protein [Glaesserella parasuis]MCT8529793.1 hydroxypyruvate isomerase family protein [Glaesserella parasuis]MCT8532313.1 hydroxypyruvate isomerase family protein [Glaesserella parasuis]MCT8536767.1 hydroxypyruvate isomerase family protein [Glaesserella parasuis]